MIVIVVIVAVVVVVVVVMVIAHIVTVFSCGAVLTVVINHCYLLILFSEL